MPKQPVCIVVDDEPRVRTLLRMVLESGGFETLEAGDGLEAASVLRSRARYIDLVVSDMNMPLMNGLALAALVRAEFPGTPFILVTGYAADPVEGVQVLQKPFLPAALLSAANEVLARSPASAPPQGASFLPGPQIA